MTHAYQERVKMTRRRVRSSERETGSFPLLRLWRKSELRVMVDCCLLVLVCEAVEDFIMFWLRIEIGYCNWYGWLRFKVEIKVFFLKKL